MSRDCPCPRPENPIGRCSNMRPVQQSPSDAPLTSTHHQEDHRPHIRINVPGGTVEALMDTGAVNSYVGDRLARQWDLLGVPKAPAVASSARLANGDIVAVPTTYQVEIEVDNHRFEETFGHLGGLSSEMVIGMDILRRRQFSLELGSGQISVNNRPVNMETRSVPCFPIGVTEASPPLTLTDDEETRVQAFLQEELPSVEGIRGVTPLIEHRIRLTNPEPIKQRHRPRTATTTIKDTCSRARDNRFNSTNSTRISRSARRRNRGILPPVLLPKYLPVGKDLCWKCGRPGHNRSSCLRKQPVLFCSRCGLKGTLSRDCPCLSPRRTPATSDRFSPLRNPTPCPIAAVRTRSSMWHEQIEDANTPPSRDVMRGCHRMTTTASWSRRRSALHARTAAANNSLMEDIAKIETRPKPDDKTK